MKTSSDRVWEGQRMLWENPSGCLIPPPSQSRSSHNKMPKDLWSFSPRVESCQPFWAPFCTPYGTKLFSFILSKCPSDWFFCLKDTDFSSFCQSKTTFYLLFFIALPQSTWWRNYEAYRKARLWEMTDMCHLLRLSVWCSVAHGLGFSL